MDEIDPKDSALKSFFLGPQAENKDWVQQEINQIFQHWFKWRESQFPQDGRVLRENEKKAPWFKETRDRLANHLIELMKIYEEETPTFTPRYIGHMVSEISLPALLGHIVNLLHNPNLASKDVSRAGSKLEKAAIRYLIKMVGYSQSEGTGHFTSGGTIANFEALWRARYRLDHWLSLGTFLQQNKMESKSLFAFAHQG